MQRILVCLLSIVSLGLTPAVAAEGYTYELTALRSGPSTKHKVIAWIPEDAKIDMRDCNDGWCKVTWNGVSGYSRYGSIDYTDDYEDCVFFGDCY